MSKDFDRRAIERALSTRAESPQPPGVQWSLAQADWTSTCRVCGMVLKGTIAQIKAHTHGEEGK